jgi:putative acetyltransferase
VDIKLDDLSGPEIAVFLEAHLQDMKATSPPESKHALDLEGLRQPEVTFWTVWEQGTLIGCGAIKALDADHGEIKSMRTAPTYRGRGVASRLLQHILQEARQRDYRRQSLETGSMVFFEPARRLYAKHGFEECPPFGDYWADPNSVFMTRTL